MHLDKVGKPCKHNSEIFLKTKSTQIWILRLFFFTLRDSVVLFPERRKYTVGAQNRALEEH
jgi:hypothetical protein